MRPTSHLLGTNRPRVEIYNQDATSASVVTSYEGAGQNACIWSRNQVEDNAGVVILVYYDPASATRPQEEATDDLHLEIRGRDGEDSEV